MTLSSYPLRVGLLVIALSTLCRSSAAASAPEGHYAQSGKYVRALQTGLLWSPTLAATYSWFDAPQACAGLGEGWRVPTCKELLTLVDLSSAPGSPRIDPYYFPVTQTDDYYWSATERAADNTHAWWVSFADGSSASKDADGLKSSLHYVRCVR